MRHILDYRSFFALCKPRVTALIVFTALIGILLAIPTMDIPYGRIVLATLGIALVSSSAAAFNCLIEQSLDARMARTRGRPLPTGKVSVPQTVVFASVLGIIGLAVLYSWVNPLTMWLTLATFVGYAVLYTIFLKPATPMNIVIGGASGAMPPLLGWSAISNTITPEALVLFLIIFAWTPPHFWALALYRREEYAKIGMPMLPVTHGEAFTLLHIVLYSIILVVVSLMPYALKMSDWLYLGGVLLLNVWWMYWVIRLYKHYTHALAQTVFRHSITYLIVLFALLLVDHWVL